MWPTIIAIYTHPIHGRAYLWSMGNYRYSLGKVNTNLMTWDGYTHEDVQEYLDTREWVLESESR